MRKHIKGLAVLVSIAAIMAFGATAAFAQSASQGGYDEAAPLGQIIDSTGGGDAGRGGDEGAGGGGHRASGALPFTGLDLGIAALLGITLAGTGLLVRRAGRAAS